jgi:hypothetical protein
MAWHYTAGGKTEGPVPESRLRELLPTLPVDAMVWSPDLGAWKTPREAGLAPPPMVKAEPPPPAQPRPAEKQWHYMAGGKTEGPVPESRLRELLPTLPAEAVVWNPDLDVWKTPREAGLAPPVIVNEVPRQPSHEPTQPLPAEKQWHYALAGKTEGPVPESRLRELLPILPAEAVVWNPDLDVWKTPREAGLAPPAIVNEVPGRSPKRPVATQKQWHYAVAGKTEGPVPESQLRELLPTLPVDAMVWSPDLGAWKTPREAGLTERPDLGPAISAGGERAQR